MSPNFVYFDGAAHVEDCRARLSSFFALLDYAHYLFLLICLVVFIELPVVDSSFVHSFPAEPQLFPIHAHPWEKGTIGIEV